MTKKFGYFTEALDALTVPKLTAIKIYNEARKRDYDCYHFTSNDLFYVSGEMFAHARVVEFYPERKAKPFYKILSEEKINLRDLDIFFLRKDPPLNQEYITFTYLLDQLEAEGMVFVNSPSAMRNSHSKLLTLKFPEYIAPCLLSFNRDEINNFIKEHKKVIVKPLNASGGKGILILEEGDVNLNSMIDTVMVAYDKLVMFQKFIPEAVSEGDKRIILFDGEPRGAIMRRPAEGDFRANITAGGSFVKSELTEREKEICAAMKPYLQKNGLFFVGLDVIGGYVTEINATCPGALTHANIAYGCKFEEQFWDVLEAKMG